VRTILVELGRAITDAKAQVLAKLCAQLKREIEGKRRAGARLKTAAEKRSESSRRFRASRLEETNKMRRYAPARSY
jgi:hypothetical protein